MIFRTAAATALLVAIGCDSVPIAPGQISIAPRLMLEGRGIATERYSAELWVRGTVAYTTTWGSKNGVIGNAIKIWNVAGAAPILADSVIVATAGTVGDVQVTDDGLYLVAAVEPTPNGAVVIYSLADPLHPAFVARYQTSQTSRGVHTAALERVNGVQYAFLCIDPGGGLPGNLLIVSLANPAAPVVVNSAITGQPYIHDVFVRDGLLLAAGWDGGLRIYDIGGGNRGGTPGNPVLIRSVLTRGGDAHNIWWFHGASGERRYAFVGEEGPAGGIGSSSGDIHVVDISDFGTAREVAFYNAPGAGTHNFSMDEARGILYAAYYNGGVKALDVRGDLSVCDAALKSADGRCDLGKMGREIANSGRTDPAPAFVWGVHFLSGKLYATDMLSGLWKYEGVVPR